MKKVFAIEDLACAHCAAKMENAIRALEGVSAVSINFVMQKLTLEAPDDVFEEVLKKAVKICRKIEPECRVIVK